MPVIMPSLLPLNICFTVVLHWNSKHLQKTVTSYLISGIDIDSPPLLVVTVEAIYHICYHNCWC